MAEISDNKSEASSFSLQREATASDGHALPATPGFEEFDRQILHTLGCIKAINFQHIAFIGKNLDRIPIERAYKTLWHEESPRAERSFMRLKKLCAKGFIVPWQSWDPNRILTRPKGRARAKKLATFYILGRKGRRWIEGKLSYIPTPGIIDELYVFAVPLARWLTASTCALTLQSEGYALVPFNQVWNDRDDVPRPAFRPDFTAVKQNPAAFYVYDSPFGLRSEFFVAHVGRGLLRMNLDSMAVILTRTREAFARVMVAMRGNSLGDNKQRVYVGDLATFRDRLGHCTVVNGEGKQTIL